MLVSFAHPDGSVDIVSIGAFLESVEAHDLPATLSALAADPTDVLSVADVARMTDSNEHAVLLYKWALDKLERDPSTASHDTNLAGGYYFHGKTLLELRRPAEAVRPLTMYTELSGDDAAGWYLLGLALSRAGDCDEALRHLWRARQLEGIDSNQNEEFFAAVRNGIALARQERLRRELETAPELFRRGFDLMRERDWPSAARIMAQAAEGSDEWSDAARCCSAYCLERLDRHADALAQLDHASPAKLNAIWQWYFHNTSAHSLNMVDKLPAALDACDAALEHFRGLGSYEDVANFLALKANILKQQAFALSRTPKTHAEGRPIIISAIECLAQSMALQPPEGNELDEELDGMARIAARMEVDTASLSLPEAPANVKAMLVARFCPSVVAGPHGSAMSTFRDREDALRQFGDFQCAAVEEDWFRVRMLGGQLIQVAPMLGPDSLFNFLFNMAAACHSLYKEFPGGPRDAFAAMIQRPERDRMFLLSALYWAALEALYSRRRADFEDPDRAYRAIREHRAMFVFKLGGLIGAPAARKEMFLRAVQSIGPAEAELLNEHIVEAKDFVASH